jgi:hypothetical protein
VENFTIKIIQIMKTLVITLLGLSTLFSCKKKYTCVCTTSKHYDGNFEEGKVYDFYDPATTNTRTIKDKKKENAETSCKSGNNVTYETGFYESQGQEPTVVTTICEIK